MVENKERNLFVRPFIDLKCIRLQERYKLLLDLEFEFDFSEKELMYENLKSFLREKKILKNDVKKLASFYVRKIYKLYKLKLKLDPKLNREGYSILLGKILNTLSI